MNGNWIVPFKGRNSSGAYTLNFLWNSGEIYVMDNHRAALWCWLQHLKKGHVYNYFHIDRHYDALTSQIDKWDSVLPDLWSLGIEEYLKSGYKAHTGDVFPTIRWDNYLSILLKRQKNIFKSAYFATHKEGDKPHIEFFEVDMWDLPGNFSFWISDCKRKWVCNLDLDYFFFDKNHDKMDRMLSLSYCEKLFSEIGKNLIGGNIEVLTIAMSPDCCGGWQASESLLEVITKSLGVEFSLPHDEV